MHQLDWKEEQQQRQTSRGHVHSVEKTVEGGKKSYRWCKLVATLSCQQGITAECVAVRAEKPVDLKLTSSISDTEQSVSGLVKGSKLLRVQFTDWVTESKVERLLRWLFLNWERAAWFSALLALFFFQECRASSLCCIYSLVAAKNLLSFSIYISTSKWIEPKESATVSLIFNIVSLPFLQGEEMLVHW